MNENIDLTKILEGCPEGTEFYCSIYGVVKFMRISAANWIIISTKIGNRCISKMGKFDEELFSDDECIFFPSKEQRDWSKFERFWDKHKEDYEKDYKDTAKTDIMCKETYPTKGTTTIEKAAEVFSEMLVELWPDLLGFGGIAKKWENEFRKRLEE